MRVYISIDAEGCSGIYKLAQVDPGNADYEFCRRMMEGDANAAIRGAFNAGASEVVLNDAHNLGDNLRIDRLDPRAKLISGNDRPLSMMEGIAEGSYDAALLLGYHSRKGERGVISHTYYYSSMYEVLINGCPVGEAEINGFLAGHFGVPLVFLSGDQCVTENIRQKVPGIHTVTTKRAIGCGAAECLHPEVVQKKIEEGVQKALLDRKNIRPMGEAPYALEARFLTPGHAAFASMLPGSQRPAPSVVRFEAADYGALFNAFLCIITLAAGFRERQ